MAFPTGWGYKKPITLTNSGSSLTNYQELLVVDTSTLVTAGKMLSSGADIIFSADGSTTLPYWIESGMNTTTTNIWVNVASVPNGTSTIYMYYGNSGASATQDITTTFIYGIDWTTKSSLPASWTSVGITSTAYSSSTGITVTIPGSTTNWKVGIYLNSQSFASTTPIIVRQMGLKITSNGYGFATGLTTAPSGSNTIGGAGTNFEFRQADGTPRWGIEPVSGGSTSAGVNGGSSALNTLYTFEALYKGSNTQDLQVGGTSQVTATNTTQTPVFLSMNGGGSTQSIYLVKQTVVRQYVSSVPSYSIGSEIVIGSPLFFSQI